MKRWLIALFVGLWWLTALPAGLGAEGTTYSLYLPLVLRGEAFSQAALDVTYYTNQYRQQYGCPPLTLDEKLTQAAQKHSEDMALNDFFSHTGSDGSSPWDRIRATGYDFLTAGENLAAGYPDAKSVVDAWMNSEGHRTNILNCDFEEIGVGYYYLPNDSGQVVFYHYWTQVFAKPKQ